MPRSYGITNAAPYASAPTVGAAGDTYFNTTNKCFYVSDGTSWLRIAGTAPVINTITATGSGTWTKPARCVWIRVRCQGAGGGGGGATGGTSTRSVGGGGGGGAYAERVYIAATDLSGISTVSYSVGGGGGGGVGGGADGGNGGDTTFSWTTALVGGGGVGGKTGAAVSAGGQTPTIGAAGGTATGAGAGTGIQSAGGYGLPGSCTNTGLLWSGGGGPAVLGFGALPVTTAPNAGNNGRAYGGGGSGAGTGTPNQTGGSGADGLLVIEEYY